MNDIQKFLSKLSKKEKAEFLIIFRDILTLSLDGYNVTKMKGYNNLYRLRTGGIRVLFVKEKEMGIITAMGYRKDIYKKI